MLLWNGTHPLLIFRNCYASLRQLLGMQMERRTQVEILNRSCMSIGLRAWRHLLHCLIETSRLYGPFGELLCSPDSVWSQFCVSFTLPCYTTLLWKTILLSDRFMIILNQFFFSFRKKLHHRAKWHAWILFSYLWLFSFFFCHHQNPHSTWLG